MTENLSVPIQTPPVADARVLGERMFKLQTQLAPVSGPVFKQALKKVSLFLVGGNY